MRWSGGAISLFFLPMVGGCPWVTDKEWEARLDRDGDGIPIPEDCDPDDAAIGSAAAWYADADGDGHGDPDAGTVACTAPDGAVAVGDDCDDADAEVSPAADERCDDVDDDCDGSVDEDGAVDATAWHSDQDEDGYGDAAVYVVACAAPVDGVADDTDCDDADPGAFPGATEICDLVDQDCDGQTWDTEDYITVSTDGSSVVGVWSSIQAGVDAAQREGPGAVVCVADGAYDEAVVVDGSLGDLSLVGALGSADTVIDGQDYRVALTVRSTSAETVIEGLLVTRGRNEGGCGGGVFLEDSAATLRNLIVTDSSANAGGGICVSGGSPSLTGVVVVNNSATGNGGGLYVEGDLSLDQVRLEGNAAASRGGAIYVEDDMTIATDVTLEGNTANTGGAVGIGGDATLGILGGRIWSNAADGTAGAIYLEGESPTLDATWLDVRDNTGLTGGAIAADLHATLRFTNAVFAGNTSTALYGFAGAIDSIGAVVQVSFSTFVRNSTQGDGGAMAFYEGAPGEGPYAISDSSFNDNTAASEGGALYGMPAATTIDRSNVDGNTPEDTDLSYYGTDNISGCSPDFDLEDADPTLWDLEPSPGGCLSGIETDGTDLGAYGGPLGSDWPTEWP